MQKQIIKIAGEAVGALLPQGDRFRFLAVKFNVWQLDGVVFANHHEAHKALTAHLATTRQKNASLTESKLH